MQIFCVDLHDKGGDVLLVAACVVMSSQMEVEVEEDIQVLKKSSQETKIHSRQHHSEKGNYPSPTVDDLSANPATAPFNNAWSLGSRYR